MARNSNIKRSDLRFQTGKTRIDTLKISPQSQKLDKGVTDKLLKVALDSAYKGDDARNKGISVAQNANDLSNLKAYIINGRDDSFVKEYMRKNPGKLESLLKRVSDVIRPHLANGETLSDIFALSAETKQKMGKALDEESSKLQTECNELKEEEERHLKFANFLIEAIKDMFRSASQIVRNMSNK